MIRIKIVFHGKTILLSSWRHLPRVGELIRINGELYCVQQIIHDVDEMQSNRVHDVIIHVQRSTR